MYICSECLKLIQDNTTAIIHETWEKGEEPKIIYIAHKECYAYVMSKDY